MFSVYINDVAGVSHSLDHALAALPPLFPTLSPLLLLRLLSFPPPHYVSKPVHVALLLGACPPWGVDSVTRPLPQPPLPAMFPFPFTSTEEEVPSWHSRNEAN